MARPWFRARAPATIANVGPGLDVLCLAVRGPHDIVAVRPAASDSLRVSGVDAGVIPSAFTENTAGIVIDAMRRRTGIRTSLEVRVAKGLPAGRGLGSSAASCAGAALAFLEAFPKARTLRPVDVVHAAVEGEAAVAGRHYDNVAGALLGGFVSIASTDPLVLAREPVSPRIHVALAIPDLVLRTEDMRRALPQDVPLGDAISNVGQAATLAVALVRGDAVLAGRCLDDRFATPRRAPYLKGYAEARDASLRAGATGFSISGSGSTVFALAASRTAAQRSAKAMAHAFRAVGGNAKALATRVDNAVPLRRLLGRAGSSFTLATP
ncbi:MAG: homoserine kinase [Methanobacteriota archaeon]